MIKKSKAGLRLLTAAVAAAGLLAGSMTDVCAAATMVETVHIYFPENAHIEYGSSINGFLQDIVVDTNFTTGAEVVAAIPNANKTNEDKQYSSYIVGKEKIGSSSQKSVNINTDVIEEEYEYTVQFYYRALDGYVLPSGASTDQACVNGEAVDGLYLAGSGDKYRQVSIILSPSNWGNINYDLKNGSASISNRSAALVLERTLWKLDRNSKIKCKKTGTYKTQADLDNDDEYDIEVIVGAKGTTGQKVTKLEKCSVKEGKKSFTIPKSDMAYEGEGICCNRSVFENLTFDFGEISEAKKDISAATVSAIPDQTYTGSDIEPAVVVSLDGKTLTKDADYVVVYSNNREVGSAKVTITGKGNYTGTVVKAFVIKSASSGGNGGQGDQGGNVGQGGQTTDPANPGDGQQQNPGQDVVEHEQISLAKAKIKSAKAKAKKKIVVKWSEVENADGYEIAYTTDKKFKKSVKTVTTEKETVTLKKLKKGKVYYIRVRAYVQDDDKKITGKWSAAKRIKAKK
ncbi:MAG: fibronectin type III domain-containing protein [Lachnospiraceae bacterium]|nr:fibronectin type III domain-containing protein [Lachnospiraceae bacterium]